MERAKHLKYKKILRAMVLMRAVLTVGGSRCGRYDKFSWSRRGY